MTLEDLVSKAFEHLKPVSRSTYDLAWAKFVKAGDVHSVERLRSFKGLELEAVMTKLKASPHNYAPATVAQMLVVVRFVVRRGILLEVLERDFTAGVKAPIGDNVPYGNVLKPGELETLAATEDLKLGTMERAVVLTMALQGLRVSEFCDAKWGDVILQGRGALPGATPGQLAHQLRVMGKGGKFATMGIQKLVMEAALAWAKEHTKPEDYFVSWETGAKLHRTTVTRLIKKLTKKHLGHVVSSHGLRATFISDVISRRGIEVARQLARHSSIATSVRYSRWGVTEDEERVLFPVSTPSLDTSTKLVPK